MGFPGFPAALFRDCGGVSLFFSREKKSNQKKRAASREPVLRTGTLRSSVRRGTARELAALRHPRLCALAGPAVLGSLEGGLEKQSEEHPRMAWIYWVQLRPLTLGPPYSEPSIAGESGAKRRRCLSEASSAPSPDSPRSAGCRCAAPARGRRRVSLVTFLMAHIHVRHPTGRLRRSALLLQRGARAKKVTPPYNHPFCRASRYASIRLATPSLPMHSDR